MRGHAIECAKANAASRTAFSSTGEPHRSSSTRLSATWSLKGNRRPRSPASSSWACQYGVETTAAPAPIAYDNAPLVTCASLKYGLTKMSAACKYCLSSSDVTNWPRNARCSRTVSFSLAAQYSGMRCAHDEIDKIRELTHDRRQGADHRLDAFVCAQ